MSAFSVEGKNVVVTGAAMGIGFGISKRLAEMGARVVMADLKGGPLEEAAHKLAGAKGQVATVVADVADEGAGGLMVKRCLEAFGPVDVLVNNAGIFPQTPMLKMTPDAFDRVYQVNLKGLAFVTQAVARHMIERGNGGNIINIGSIDSLHPSMVGLAAYDASKGGVLMLTRSLALELAPHRIRVNIVLPGGIATEGTAAPLAGSGMSVEQMKEMMAAFTQRIPMKRMGVPDDIAKVVVFLASPASEYMTGSSLVVDGGMLLS